MLPGGWHNERIMPKFTVQSDTFFHPPTTLRVFSELGVREFTFALFIEPAKR